MESASSSTAASAEGRAAPAPALGPDALIESYIPKIVSAYVRGRVDALVGPDAEAALEELNDIEALEDQLDHLPTICRFHYEPVAAGIASILDPLAHRYSDGITYLRSNPSSEAAFTAMRVVECQLSWIINVIGAIIGGAAQASSPYFSSYGYIGGSATTSSASPSTLTDEACDADLARRVLTLVSQIDTRLSSAMLMHQQGGLTSAAAPVLRMFRCDARLELSFVYFMSNFRKAYVTEQAGMPSTSETPSGGQSGTAAALLLAPTPPASGSAPMASSAAPTMQEMLEAATGRRKTFLGMLVRMGLGDHLAIVTTMIQKLANNLRYWGERQDIIKRTLEVLHDLVFSYSSGKLLLTLDCVSGLLLNHTAEYFPFLGHPANTHLRTIFYTTLARLVFMEDETEKFEPFMAPVIAGLDRLASLSTVRSEESMRLAIGLARDVRGILSATHNRPTYLLAFEALYPKHVKTLIRCAETYADTPAVTSAVLKALSELVLNKAQRIVFGPSSASGILLFREASQLLSAYGNRILGYMPTSRQYEVKYKGISICTTILARCLDGGYVNFGVFSLYGDPALDVAMDIAFKLLLSVTAENVVAHPKLALAYTTLLHLVFRSHIEFFVALPQPAFMQIIRVVTDGIDSLDAEVCGQAATALDHLSTFYVRNAKKDTPAAQALRRHVSTQPGMFEELAKMLFGILVFGESANQWTLARPLLACVVAAELIRPESFEAFKRGVVASQPADVQARMTDEFGTLMKDITRSLDVTNRERFSHRLTQFRTNVRDFAVV